MTGLEARIDATVGTLDLAVDLHVPAGGVTAVVGPNGSGKSTLLRILCGLLAPTTGRVTLGGRTLLDTEERIALDPADRRVGMVFQDYLLFDHMSALENVAFGPRSRGVGRRAAESGAAEWLERVGLGAQADARPAALSGGQQQRVALARALAVDPECLLLDEPLSALDADTRGAVRRELRRHLVDFDGPVLVVTHEPLEALALADHLVVLEAGRVTQAGVPADVARRPRSDWVARLVGTNLFTGVGSAEGLQLDGGGIVVVAGPVPTGPALATVHPRRVALHRTPPTGSPRNVWRGTVGAIELANDRVRVQVTRAAEVTGAAGIVAEITPAATAELGLADGGEVWATFKAADVDVYPR